MKICMCSFTGFSSLNGSNLRVFHLTNELVKRGHELNFIVPNHDDAESCRERFGVPASDIGLDIKRFSASRLKLYPRFAFRAKKLVDKNSDIVFGQSLPSALAVRMSKTSGKRVVDYVDLWSEYWLYAHPSIKGRVVYSAVRRAEGYSLKVDAVTTITEKIKEMLVSRGCRPEKIKVVRDGVDTKMFRPMKVQGKFFEKYGLDKKTDYVIYQGGIGAHDGVQFLIKAAPLVLDDLPEAKFLIVGTGDYVENIKNLVMDSGLVKNFIFTGWVPYTDMPYFMNIAKVNAVPIPDAPATRGVVTLKLFEAMACGKPTVIGDLPGVREHIKDGETGRLVKSEDAKKLSGAICGLISDKTAYDKISRNGLRIVKEYDWRLIAKDLANTILG